MIFIACRYAICTRSNPSGKSRPEHCIQDAVSGAGKQIARISHPLSGLSALTWWSGYGQKVGPGRRTGLAEAHPGLNEVKGLQAPDSQNNGSEKKSKTKALTLKTWTKTENTEKGELSAKTPGRLDAHALSSSFPVFSVFVCVIPC